LDLRISYLSPHGRVVLVDPLHLFCRIPPPHDDADGPVRGGTAQDDLSLVEELPGIGQVLPHHGLLLGVMVARKSGRYGLKVEMSSRWGLMIPDCG